MTEKYCVNINVAKELPFVDCSKFHANAGGCTYSTTNKVHVCGSGETRADATEDLKEKVELAYQQYGKLVDGRK